jgi:hypothetical protein
LGLSAVITMVSSSSRFSFQVLALLRRCCGLFTAIGQPLGFITKITGRKYIIARFYFEASMNKKDSWNMNQGFDDGNCGTLGKRKE